MKKLCCGTIPRKISLKLGLYYQARWFYRHFFNRLGLKQERSDLAFYSKMLHKNNLVFDVGANYGEKTRLFLKLGAKVVAFEPQSDCIKELRLRCGDNGRLTTVRSALSSKTGTAEFYVCTNRGVSSLLKNWRKDIESIIEVPLVTLDSMIDSYGKPMYIKIDVEGCEYEVLSGLSHPIKLISFEYHLREEFAKKPIDCINYLSRLGKVSLNITPAENLAFEYSQWLNKKDFINLFIKDIPKKPGFSYGEIWVKM